VKDFRSSSRFFRSSKNKNEIQA